MYLLSLSVLLCFRVFWLVHWNFFEWHWNDILKSWNMSKKDFDFHNYQEKHSAHPSYNIYGKHLDVGNVPESTPLFKTIIWRPACVEFAWANIYIYIMGLNGQNIIHRDGRCFIYTCSLSLCFSEFLFLDIKKFSEKLMDMSPDSLVLEWNEWLGLGKWVNK